MAAADERGDDVGAEPKRLVELELARLRRRRAQVVAGDLFEVDELACCERAGRRVVLAAPDPVAAPELAERLLARRVNVRGDELAQGAGRLDQVEEAEVREGGHRHAAELAQRLLQHEGAVEDARHLGHEARPLILALHRRDVVEDVHGVRDHAVDVLDRRRLEGRPALLSRRADAVAERDSLRVALLDHQPPGQVERQRPPRLVEQLEAGEDLLYRGG